MMEEGHSPTEGLGEGMSDGTTIISMKYAGGILMAADGRSSSDAIVGNRVSDKLEPIHHRIYA